MSTLTPVPDSKAARKSVLWAIGPIGIFYLMTLALGFGAAALVGVGRDGGVRSLPALMRRLPSTDVSCSSYSLRGRP